MRVSFTLALAVALVVAGGLSAWNKPKADPGATRGTAAAAAPIAAESFANGFCEMTVAGDESFSEKTPGGMDAERAAMKPGEAMKRMMVTGASDFTCMSFDTCRT